MIDRIKALIAANRWTQQHAASLCGLTQPRISDLQRGNVARFSLDALVNITAALERHSHPPKGSAMEYTEEEGQRLAERVKERTAELTEMATHLVNAREDERAHIARELHDEMGGLFTSMKLDFARLRRLPELPAKAIERIQAIEARLGEGIALKRRIIEVLHPSALTQLGLVQALEILCRETGERLGTAVHADLQDVRLDKLAELTLYRIAQESLTNIVKYASCQQVEVRLHTDGQAVCLSVRDNGRGFDPARVPHGRHGLRGMRVRVESHGGELTVQSAPGEGTTVLARLPSPARQG